MACTPSPARAAHAPAAPQPAHPDLSGTPAVSTNRQPVAWQCSSTRRAERCSAVKEGVRQRDRGDHAAFNHVNAAGSLVKEQLLAWLRHEPDARVFRHHVRHRHGCWLAHRHASTAAGRGRGGSTSASSSSFLSGAGGCAGWGRCEPQLRRARSALQHITDALEQLGLEVVRNLGTTTRRAGRGNAVGACWRQGRNRHEPGSHAGASRSVQQQQQGRVDPTRGADPPTLARAAVFTPATISACRTPSAASVSRFATNSASEVARREEVRGMLCKRRQLRARRARAATPHLGRVGGPRLSTPTPRAAGV